VVRGFDADVVVVLESWRDHDGRSVLDPLTADGYRIETIPFRKMYISSRRARHEDPGEGLWEIGICSRVPIIATRELPIGTIHADPAGPRSALLCTIDMDGVEVDIVAVHVSSRLWTFAPVRHLLALRPQLPPAARHVVIAGDCNLWGPAVVAIFKQWRRSVMGPTYPAHRPHHQIDHILVRDDVTVLSGEVLAETPSDHRPIRARLRVGGAGGPGKAGGVG
jgi:endonuclease/exonuclease/phosphatase family metal-dependent hydrolase